MSRRILLSHTPQQSKRLNKQGTVFGDWHSVSGARPSRSVDVRARGKKGKYNGPHPGCLVQHELESCTTRMSTYGDSMLRRSDRCHPFNATRNHRVVLFQWIESETPEKPAKRQRSSGPNTEFTNLSLHQGRMSGERFWLEEWTIVTVCLGKDRV
jgi:hypothetical protein